MTKLDQLLTDDLRETHLNIPTLRPRKSDALDFHDVAVWSVRAALAAAFDAGAKATGSPSETGRDLPTRYDGYEIQPCRRFEEPDSPGRFYFESCNPDEADVWTLYGHVPGQGVDAIGDFETYQHAEEVFARITGRSYSDTFAKTREG